jgi:hypothetical protein
MTSPVIMGQCTVVVDEVNETICNSPSTSEVLVRTAFGLHSAFICPLHLSEHRKFYAARRDRRGKPTERSSHQGDTHQDGDDDQDQQAVLLHLPVAA